MSDDSVIVAIVNAGFKLLCVVTGALTVSGMWTRWMKSRTIRDKGYPPEYCDAEGDKICNLDFNSKQ